MRLWLFNGVLSQRRDDESYFLLESFLKRIERRTVSRRMGVSKSLMHDGANGWWSGKLKKGFA
jgi:hypothetical protein